MPSLVKSNSIRTSAIARSLSAALKAIGSFCKGQVRRRGLPVREFLLGLSALGSGNLAKAKVHFRQVLVKRANALIGLGRSREAISVYRWVLQLNPTWTEARYGLATALVSVARCDEAVQEFNRLLSNDPNRLEFYMGLGSAHHLAGRIDDAVEAWSKGMAVQKCLAQAASVPSDVRYLTELWSCAIGHTSILDFFVKRHLLGLFTGSHYIVLAPADPANPNSVLRITEFGVPISLVNLNSFTATTSVNAALAALNGLRPDPSKGEGLPYRLVN